MRDWMYRHYVANSLWMLPEHRRYSLTLNEMMNPANIDNRSAEEITKDVVNNAGIILLD